MTYDVSRVYVSFYDFNIRKYVNSLWNHNMIIHDVCIGPERKIYASFVQHPVFQILSMSKKPAMGTKKSTCNDTSCLERDDRGWLT